MEPETELPRTELRGLQPARRAHEFVAHELLVLILSGRFGPGDRLPPERALATEFGVSRPTVRQAVAVLAARGLVETKIGSGTFVVGLPSTAAGVETAGRPALGEIVEARLVFEVGAARLAARRARRSREDVDLLAAMVEALEDGTERDAFPAEIAVVFHKTIVQMTGNPHLETLIAPFLEQSSTAIVAAAGSSWTQEDTARMASQHRQVLEALRLGDPELAGFEMERHLRTEHARLAGGAGGDEPPARFFA
jgi:GntR family transcriptional repressor for pyruvate dehydrogenase complex